MNYNHPVRILRHGLILIMVVFLVASIGTYMLLFGHAAPADSSQPFLRYYDSTTAAHLYLRQSNPPNDPTDWAPDRASDYSFEFTIGYILPTQTNGSIPLYRLYSYNNGDNFYTADYSQAVLAQQSYGYKYVGVEGYVQPSKITSTKPLYRLYLPWGTHFYTTIATERDSSVSNGATYEGIEGYLYNQAGLGGTPAPTPTPTPTPTPAPAPTPTPAPTPSGGGSTTTIKTTRSPTPAPLQTTSSDSGTADLSVGTSTSDGTNTGTSGSDSQDSSGGSSPSQATTTTGTQAKAKKTSSAGGWILTALLALLMIGALVVLRLRNRNVAPAIDEDMVSPLPPAQPPVIPEAPAPASSSPMHLPPPPKAGNIWQEKINEAFYPNQPHPNSGANQKSDEPLDMFELAQQDPKNFGHDASADSAQPAQPAPPPPPKPSAPKVTPQARPATRPKHVPRLPHEHNPKLPAEETVVKLHKHDS